MSVTKENLRYTTNLLLTILIQVKIDLLITISFSL